MNNKCVDCGREVSTNITKRCLFCYNKLHHKEKNKCIDCGKEILLQSKRCHFCNNKYFSGKNNSRWKEKNKCCDCGKELSKKSAKRCLFCRGKYFSGENNPNWRKLRYFKCIDCGKKIDYRSKRCLSCSRKDYIKNSGINLNGCYNPNYKNGRQKCIDCGKELLWYGSTKRCLKCAHKNKDYRKKMSMIQKNKWDDKNYQKKQAVARYLKPNKPETLLNILLDKHFPREYKYVGDFKFWLGGKNPDFMNVNGQKKLVELWGNFWHKGDDPKDRINHFKKYGFNTLIVWEKELKDIPRLEKRLKDFHNKRNKYDSEHQLIK